MILLLFYLNMMSNVPQQGVQPGMTYYAPAAAGPPVFFNGQPFQNMGGGGGGGGGRRRQWNNNNNDGGSGGNNGSGNRGNNEIRDLVSLMKQREEKIAAAKAEAEAQAAIHKAELDAAVTGIRQEVAASAEATKKQHDQSMSLILSTLDRSGAGSSRDGHDQPSAKRTRTQTPQTAGREHARGRNANASEEDELNRALNFDSDEDGAGIGGDQDEPDVATLTAWLNRPLSLTGDSIQNLRRDLDLGAIYTVQQLTAPAG